MGDAADSATSVTLLCLLCGPKKDEKAWRRFCDRYEPSIRKWCHRWSLQAADQDDIKQKVLKRVFTKIHTFDPCRGRFRAWLKTVVENTVRDFLRGKRRRPGDQGSGDSAVTQLLKAPPRRGAIDALARDLDNGLGADMEALLARVEGQVKKPETMRAFRMSVLEGRRSKEAAAELGMTVAAFYVTVNRVKKMVRQEWARINGCPPNAKEGERS
jgi:RNA polymerase sigma factor (sigma-70 family)